MSDDQTTDRNHDAGAEHDGENPSLAVAGPHGDELSATEEAATDDDGTPVENPAG